MGDTPVQVNAANPQHHRTEWIAYQPHSHLTWLALARNGLLVAVAAFLVLASVRWLGQHPAE